MLGLILSPLGQRVAGQYPNEISYAYGGQGTYLDPFDPQFNTQGESGCYFDTPLGMTLNGPQIPTDAELAKSYSEYTPVAGAWINGKFNGQDGYWPSPWRVPGGWGPAGAWGGKMSLSGATVLGLSPLGWGLIAAGAVGALMYFRRRK
jgi:hypothetical protein